jgi:hypothetical protein
VVGIWVPGHHGDWRRAIQGLLEVFVHNRHVKLNRIHSRLLNFSGSKAGIWPTLGERENRAMKFQWGGARPDGARADERAPRGAAVGRVGGSKRRMRPEEVDSAHKLLNGGMTLRGMAENLGVSIAILYLWVTAASS